MLERLRPPFGFLKKKPLLTTSNNPMLQELMEHDLHRMQPEATAAYLTTMLGWPGGQHLSQAAPELIKAMDRSKVSESALGDLDAAMALRGLHDQQWGPAAGGDA